MKQVNIHEAKTHLSRLLEEVSHGNRIIISKAGKPIAQLIPYSKKVTKRKLGFMKDKIWIADDFDDALPADLFEGDLEP